MTWRTVGCCDSVELPHAVYLLDRTVRFIAMLARAASPHDRRLLTDRLSESA